MKHTSCHKQYFFLYFVIVFNLLLAYSNAFDIAIAVNVGGEEFVDSYGIQYQKDESRFGIASDYGRRHKISNIDEADQELYQTERYSTNSFGYSFTELEDGNYVLILKFCEVYFDGPGQKIFDVQLGSKHYLVKNLDIFERAGKAAAYDMVFEFKISNSFRKLTFNGTKSSIPDYKLLLSFLKGKQDNPKVNAILLIKGKIQEVQHLIAISSNIDKEELSKDDDDFFDLDDELYSLEEMDSDEEDELRNSKFNSGPEASDPWDDVSVFESCFPLIGTAIVGITFFYLIAKLLA